MSKVNLAILGATGLVGREVLSVLEERDFPLGKLALLATEESVGAVVDFKGNPLLVQRVEREAFEQSQFAVFVATPEASAEYAPAAVKAGATVIDNSPHFRMQRDVPLVIPEINGRKAFDNKGIIANPNCSTIQLLMVLHPLDQAFGVKRVVVSTYQSVSGSGKRACDELADQSVALLSLKEPLVEEYPYRIGFNLLPHIGDFNEDGYSGEEVKLKRESAKILGRGDILVSPTCVRAPLFNCHSQSVNIALKRRASRAEVAETLARFPGVSVLDGILQRQGHSDFDEDEDSLYPLPSECSNRDEVFVGRIREDDTVQYGISLWSVMDNLRKGAALNAVQIMELLAGAA